MSQDYVEGCTMRIVKYFLNKFKKRILPQRSNENVDSSQNGLIDTDLSHRALTRVRNETVPKEAEQTELVEAESSKQDKDDLNGEKEKTGDEMTQKQEQEKEKIDVLPSCSSDDNNIESSNQQITEINKSCEENNEVNNTENNIREEPAEHSGIFFHFSIFLLWFIVTGLNIPSVLTWAHNFK